MFWALRGGSGNSGVVTSFEYQLYAVGPQILGGIIAWRANHAKSVLDAYRELGASAPRELTTVAIMQIAPPAPWLPREIHGKPIVAVLVCHSGKIEDGEEKLFVKYPEHPGVAHYLIHSYDAPPIAKQGLPAARRYASIAPAAPHALHMPSHIFTRVGAWEDSVATNLRSAAVAKKAGDGLEAYHASDYAVYAYLQLARDSDAMREIEEALKVTDNNPTAIAGAYAIAAMPARYAMERGAWREAMQLQPQGNKFLFTDAITYFARALGAARSGDLAAAQKDTDELARLHKALQDAKNNYWATEVEIQRLAVAGWVALAQGKTDDALKFMRAAADLEDKNEKHIVTPGRIVPARELLGEMLLELKQPALALKEFEASHVREPNRFRGYDGAARAAEAAGDRRKAADYYAKLIELAKKADASRPEVARARAYLAQR